ncbi:hypothetical protein D1164_04285 [Mariniphaga sediminis]|uniref:Uncharacterized protein n=1 Tax=Mariniphaga sediminis TaxID=1628158 RepID=A0A399D5Z8_9BACT|nr:hypothetical protein D1164_04285 [Mariniphaga sediminis]
MVKENKPVTKVSDKIGSCTKEQEEEFYLFLLSGIRQKGVNISRDKKLNSFVNQSLQNKHLYLSEIKVKPVKLF